MSDVVAEEDGVGVGVMFKLAGYSAGPVNVCILPPGAHVSIGTHLGGVGKPPLVALLPFGAKAACFKAVVSHFRARFTIGRGCYRRSRRQPVIGGSRIGTLPHRDRGGTWSRSNHYAYLWKVAAARFAVAGRPHPPRSPDRNPLQLQPAGPPPDTGQLRGPKDMYWPLMFDSLWCPVGRRSSSTLLVV